MRAAAGALLFAAAAATSAAAAVPPAGELVQGVGSPVTWVAPVLLEAAAGPVHVAREAPRRFDRDPEATRRAEERLVQERVGERQREFMGVEAHEAQERLAAWKEEHAAEARRLLDERQLKMERFRARIAQKAKEGGDPWWLKDLPWWMPSPPEWGPLPSTMYTAYFHKPTAAPLSTPNYHPLYRAENLEPPLGHHVPLASSTAKKTSLGPSDLGDTNGNSPGTTPQPAGAAPAEGTAVQNAVTPPAAAEGNGAFLEEAAAAGDLPFFQVPTREHPMADDPDFWKPHMAPTTGAEILPERESVTVAPHVLLDRSLGRLRPYRNYWQRFYNSMQPGYKPYRFVRVPEYPPPMAGLRRRLEAHLAPVGHRFTGSMPPDFPSKFEEPTQWQVAQEQVVGMREDHNMPVPY